jgi:hypothetical protein
MLSAAAGTVAVGGAQAASADTISNVNPANGASNTTFTLTLPPGAACTGDSAHNYHLYSYAVDASKVPVSAIPTSINFSTGQPVVNGVNQPVLIDSGGSPYGPINTLPGSTTNPQGDVPTPPQFNWSPYANADFGTGFDLYPGTFNMGIACADVNGAVDGNHFWNTQVTFTALQTNPNDFTWVIPPPNQTPETPLAVGLPLSALALAGGATFVLRRRNRATAPVA